ncbi:cupredoxin domain-containing protein [Cohnella mopanensis]|uniref:cupredoxin domain-containing protein n=1 Tax=Cohnella mopanensis TaxID=2911966 RepID=UPI001EF76E08|nr:plastocyanin/azurin family copper-binding protein [Cohnella mopanensis]
MVKKSLAFLLTIAAAFMLISSIVVAESPNDGPQTWKVAVGKGNDAAGTSIDTFFPGTTYIHEGDTVIFSNGGNYPHTVTFLGDKSLGDVFSDPSFSVAAPSSPSGGKYDGKYLSSGFLFPGAPMTYEITFPTAGAYSYLCLIHSFMKGTIVVLPKGAKIPTQAEQAAAAKLEESGLQSVSAIVPHDALYTANKDGSLTYNVDLSTAQSSMNIMRMNPEVVVVSEGDSVTWTNLNPYEPHMVTFNAPKGVQVMNDDGVNPDYMGPVGSSVFDGKGVRHSGILMQNQTFTLKFTKKGTYAYDCFMHSFMMMKGTVIVVPKSAVKLTANGKAVADAAKAQWSNGTLIVAADSFANALGGKAAWDAKAKAWEVTANGKTVKTAGITVKGVVYASAEAIVRGLGGTYSWNEVTKTFSTSVGKVEATPAPAPASSMGDMTH